MLVTRRASTRPASVRPARARPARARPACVGPLGVSALLVGLFAATAPLPGSGPAAAQAAEVDPEATRLWNDFSHYVLVARPDLAAQAGEALTGLDGAAVLAAVEADDRPLRRVFDRANGMEASAGVAARLESMLAQAARDQARDPERIAADVDRLGVSQRAFDNGVDRLSAAGPYAAPELLRRLQDAGSKDLHPYLIEAMQAIGKPLVAPLSTALPELPPVPQGQVARVLAEIGYPAALPALQAVASSSETEPEARRRAERAFATIASATSVEPSTSAARLYTGLGNAAYALGSRGEMPPGFQAADNTGPVWQWSDQVGLVPVEVPGPLFADALARDAATQALRLDPGNTPALTLFLAADLRSANTAQRELGGAADPSRDEDLKPADYYLSLAGPERARDVLDRALADGDPGLALSAVKGAAATASTEGLAPLSRGLRSPSARVRFAAAAALAAARPRNAFEGDTAVVPTLASAVRRDGQRYAVVIAEDDGVRNTLSDASASAGFEPVIGGGLADVVPQVQEIPGVDLIVARGSADRVTELMSSTAGVPALSTTPVIAFVSSTDQIALAGRFGAASRLRTVVGSPDAGNLEAAARGVLERASGGSIDAAEAEEQALMALRLVRELALDSGSVLQATAALPAVVSALEDSRPAVAEAAGDAAAALDDRAAQEGLARGALGGSGDVQVAHLRDLAESATRHGNLISADMGDQLLSLVRSSDGELALASAEAHGALTLPTEHAVELILSASE